LLSTVMWKPLNRVHDIMVDLSRMVTALTNDAVNMRSFSRCSAYLGNANKHCKKEEETPNVNPQL